VWWDTDTLPFPTSTRSSHTIPSTSLLSLPPHTHHSTLPLFPISRLSPPARYHTKISHNYSPLHSHFCQFHQNYTHTHTHTHINTPGCTHIYRHSNIQLFSYIHVLIRQIYPHISQLKLTRSYAPVTHFQWKYSAR